MKLYRKSIKDTINKAYLVEANYIAEIERFAGNLSTLNSAVKEHDSEETIKDYLNRFFYETYYKDRFALKENVNNIDLAILNKNTVDSQVAVIIETKSLQNTSEMITETNLTAKSFLELVLYYMSERIIRKNIDIKHLVITNSRDWYVFDAAEFEQIFYKNKQFNKHFNDWNENKIGLKTNEWFYKEIAIPFIENSDETIIATFFQTPELSESSELSESFLTGLIPFYKILSPEHLLKLSFANDSNTLNYTFYNELLHIIGLHEVKDGAKKIIERLPENQRNEGSLLENTIYMLQINDAIYNIDPEYFKNLQQNQDNEELLFSVALELSITWLNRIIFLKLLESQLLNFNNQNEEFAFLNTDKIPDFDILQELFFEILAVEPHNRRASIKDKYKHIPYLNSSLFEPTKLERSALKINQLKHYIKLPVFDGTVLKDNKGNRFAGEKSILDYIFSFLDSYDFASDNAVKLQTKNKTIINSSVLGLIFEKINGYKEGSFFTPGYITMYICRQSIRKAVIEKFRNSNLPNFKNLANFNDLYNKIGTIPLEKANKIFNSIKICDPAVGSGHFLVSALNELIAIKSELAILTDSEGRLLRNTYCEIENDELFIAHQGELFSYNPKDKESQRIQETIFHEKQYLIENCLFGVDINPNAVHICRLRLWIELLKNAYYRPVVETGHALSLQKRELQTLPNIDINIKSGNSLISRFSLNGKGLSNGIQQKMQLATQKYKQQVIIYKSTTDKKTKQNAENEIERIKKQFSTIVNPTDKDYLEYQKLDAAIGSAPMTFSQEDKDAWNKKLENLIAERDKYKQKYEERLKAVYGNSFEWRFEFPEVLDENGNYKGFDVVIGNPPYFQLQFAGFDYSFLKNYYEIYKETGDIYSLFIELGIRILKPEAQLSFITSNRFCTTNYGSATRKYLSKFKLEKLINMNEVNVFDEANVGTLIFILKNKPKQNNQVQITEIKERETLTELHTQELSFINVKQDFFGEKQWLFVPETYHSIIQKMEQNGTPLSKISDLKINRGITTGANKYFVINEQTKNELIKADKKNEKIIKSLLKGKDIKRYNVLTNDNWIIFTRRGTNIDKYPKIKEYFLQFEEELTPGKGRKKGSYKWFEIQDNTAFYKEFEKEKLMWTRLSNINSFAISTEKEYAIDSTSFATGKNLKYYCAILNSKAVFFYFKLGSVIWGKDGIKWFGNHFDSIPIPKADDKTIQKVTQFVDKIIIAKKKNIEADTTKLENQIDKLVYKLYSLTKDEISEIEKYYEQR